jgi:release factor glutamine methyltransferase
MARFAPFIARREAHEPIALILGRREFWSLDFSVSPATLIPRPESETLIEASIAAFVDREPPKRILDLGTGTGCLLLAALSEFPTAFGVGVDRSAAAAVIAARNAAALHLADRASFICGNWAGALNARVDLVLCNPPYIASADLARLSPDVTRYEPHSALDGGADGLAAYRYLVPRLSHLLVFDGVAILELGAGQAEPVIKLARSAGLTTEWRPDLAGIPRALMLRPSPP